MYNKYQVALRTLITIRRQLNIVIVGANDGNVNDPIYHFAMVRSGKTNILLIEPNKLLLPYLRSNYSSHPSHQIANCAIGPEGTLTLYTVKQEFWDRFQPGYAKGWPSYRAATGITSAIRSHVKKALAGENIDPDIAIDILKIPAKQLGTLLEELKWTTPIDVLQVDAEGYDDVVIHNSDINYTRPKLIYYEIHNISKEKVESLEHYLSKQRYRIYKVRGNGLAVDGRINPTCIAVNLVIFMHGANGMGFILRVIRKLYCTMEGLIGRRK